MLPTPGTSLHQVLAGYRVTSVQTLSSGLLPLALGSEFTLRGHRASPKCSLVLRSSALSGLGRQAPALSLYPLTTPLSVQSPVSREENREDKATIKCETSPPSSPRTLRLEKLGHPGLSQEEGKR